MSKRIIKFRGKRVEDGKWIYGDLYHTCELTCICDWSIRPHTVEEFEVNPSTVGQFTGMFDKNGKEIYEGDILSDGYVKYEVWYSEDKAGFIAEIRDPQNDLVDYLGCYDSERMMTVIGNIHDNPIALRKV